MSSLIPVLLAVLWGIFAWNALCAFSTASVLVILTLPYGVGLYLIEKFATKRREFRFVAALTVGLMWIVALNPVEHPDHQIESAAQVLRKVRWALEQHVIEQQRCPPSLDDILDLVSEASLVDPFDSRVRLKYENRSNYCLVYSVGPDSIDQKANLEINPFRSIGANREPTIFRMFPRGIHVVVAESLGMPRTAVGDIVECVQVTGAVDNCGTRTR